MTPNQIGDRFISAAIWQLMRRSPTWLLIAIVGGALLFGWAHGSPGELNGPVRVIDGDTIVLTNLAWRKGGSDGVDAPEVVHPGYNHDDDFGPEARDEMKRIVGDAIVRCEPERRALSHERLIEGVIFCRTARTSAREIIRRGLALDCGHWSSGRYRKLEPDGVRDIIRAAPYCVP